MHLGLAIQFVEVISEALEEEEALVEDFESIVAGFGTISHEKWIDLIPAKTILSLGYVGIAWTKLADLMYDTIREYPHYVKVPFPIAKICDGDRLMEQDTF
ncbi:hypothetical protein CsSME_00028831 [Camellia sinensis var. sinensis]